MDHLALVTNFLDACPYFHADCSSPGHLKVTATKSTLDSRYGFCNAGWKPALPLLVALHDPSTGQVVGRQPARDLVSRENADEILSHLAANVRHPLALVFQSPPE